MPKKEPIYVGRNVVFFPSADHTLQPVPGICTEVRDTGHIGITCFPNKSTVVRIQRNVPHIEDERLRTNPDYARRHGGWDFPEAAYERVEKERQKQEERIRRKREEDEKIAASKKKAKQEVVDLFQQNPDQRYEELAKTATEATGLPWSVAEVRNIVTEAKQTATA